MPETLNSVFAELRACVQSGPAWQAASGPLGVPRLCGLDSIFFHDNRSRVVGIAGQQKIPGSVCTVAAAELKGPAPRSQKLEGIWDAGTSFAIICTINFANLNSDSASLSIV